MSTDPREFEHPIDGTGGTVPPLVDVIAEALYRDEAEYPGEYFKPFNEMPTRTRDAFTHQARAVLAALSEAGAVEWGVQLSDGSVEEHDTRISADDTCLDYPSTEAVVSRLTFPWERAE